MKKSEIVLLSLVLISLFVGATFLWTGKTPISNGSTGNSASNSATISADYQNLDPGKTISCTALGMIPNSSAAGQRNMTLLQQAVREGNGILVDGVYYLDDSDRVPLSDAIIYLTGITTDAEFKLRNSHPLFHIAHNVNVQVSKIKFSQVGNDISYILMLKYDCRSDQMAFDSNTFSGSIRLLEYEGETRLNPSTHAFGIRELYFIHNTVENVAVSFIRLDDMPSEKIVLEDNTVSNFDYTFFSSGITNDLPYISEMYEAKKLLVVRNNRVTCADSWWGDPTNDDYYCFVLFEGIDCVYEGNHIEGMKFYSGSGSGAALYDSYLSCKNLTYKGNTWKNNLNFNPGKQNNTLLKSKGGPNDAMPESTDYVAGGPHDVTRHYENNTYVTEYSYIAMCSAQLAKRFSQDPGSRLDQDLGAGRTEFISLTTNCSRYRIINNTFKIYDLRLPDSCLPVEEMEIAGNRFECERIGGTLLYFHVLDEIDYTGKVHIIRDNHIYSKSGLLIEPFYLVRQRDHGKFGDNRYGTIVIENNVIDVPWRYLIYQVNANRVVVTDNSVNLVPNRGWADNPGISRDSHILDLTFRNNIFK